MAVGRGAFDGDRDVLIAAGAAALLIALVRRLPRRWWIPGSAIVTGLAVVFVWIAPVLLAPVFNRFEALPENSRARAGLIALGERAGVEIGDVYRIDASRRVRSLNAYVDGIGSSKRVVLYDNLLREANRQELDSIVAHELGHVAHDDIRRGLLFVAIVSPLGLLFARELALALARRSGADPATRQRCRPTSSRSRSPPSSSRFPATSSHARSRRAPTGSRSSSPATRRRRSTVQRRLARTNLSDPDPPALARILFGTHPSTIDRIGSAIAYRRADRTKLAREGAARGRDRELGDDAGVDREVE